MHGSESSPGIAVTHTPERHRFDAQTQGKTAFLDYRRSDGTITFTHTEVPPELEGQGIGGHLAHAALEFAKTEGLRVIVRCSFVGHYVHQHPEYRTLLA